MDRSGRGSPGARQPPKSCSAHRLPPECPQTAAGVALGWVGMGWGVGERKKTFFHIFSCKISKQTCLFVFLISSLGIQNKGFHATKRFVGSPQAQAGVQHGQLSALKTQ